MLQRKKTKIGASLGKTTGWIHRLALKYKNVKMLNAVEYETINEKGLYINRKDQRELLYADNIIICAGQTSNNELFEPLKEEGISVHLIGGAEKAGELDAKRAIEQGSKLAATI